MASTEAMTIEEEDRALYGDEEVKVIEEPLATPYAPADGQSKERGSQWLCLIFADGRFEVGLTSLSPRRVMR